MTTSKNDLDEQIGDALERVGQALRVRLGDSARDLGLSPTQAQVVLRLASDPPQLRRIGALAERLDVTHPTVSDAVAALTRKGLVGREGPGRRAPLALTDGGRAAATSLADWKAPVVDQLGGIAEQDKRAAFRVLTALIAGLQREGVITVSRMCVTCRFFEESGDPDGTPHHCGLLDLPLAEDELRLDCPDYEAAP